MSCSCDSGINDNRTDCVNCRVPYYTADPTYSGISVDVAVIEQKMNVIKEEDAHIIDLTPAYLSYASFQAMFYKQSSDFNPLTGVIGKEWQPYLSNAARQVLYNSFSNQTSNYASSGVDNVDFNLVNTIKSGYEYDLSIPSECWDTCSILEFNKTLGNIKYLTDIGNECNIKCSITLDDFFNILEAGGLVMDTTTGLPLDPSGGKIIYTGLVNALITATFRSCTPGVKDIKIRWPFMINFNSVTTNTADGSANKVDGILEPSSNIWPNIYFVENVDGSKNVPTIYRSSVLAYDTVDSSGNPATNNGIDPNNTNIKGLPNYSRYSAYKYSSIKMQYT